MQMPFPGMDPYLEHPALWPGVHTRLMVELARQLRPLIRPRYVASVEDRVYLEAPEDQRIPDIWVQKLRDHGGLQLTSLSSTATPVVLEVPELEVHEHYLEILDRYREQKVVTVVELLSPTNKAGGSGRTAYLMKQKEVLGTECHLVEIDLLRRGTHILSVPESWASPLRPYDYLVCVNRWPQRRRFEVYPFQLRTRIPSIRLPLAEPDQDVPLDIQSALEQVYEDGDYALRVRYDEPCEPPLQAEDQEWADECWRGYKVTHPELFPQAPS